MPATSCLTCSSLLDFSLPRHFFVHCKLPHFITAIASKPKTMPSQPSSSSTETVRLADVFVRLPNDHHHHEHSAKRIPPQAQKTGSSEVRLMHNCPSYLPFRPKQRLTHPQLSRTRRPPQPSTGIQALQRSPSRRRRRHRMFPRPPPKDPIYPQHQPQPPRKRTSSAAPQPPCSTPTPRHRHRHHHPSSAPAPPTT